MNITPDPKPADTDRDLILLEHIDQNPDATQATLATQLGVAVGTINWHLKRLIAQGYVKAGRVERRKLRYIITPEGIALRARLTVEFIQSSFRMYRLVRKRSIDVIQQIENAGYSRIVIEGEGDVAEICRLTCLEKGISVISEENHAPILHIQGLKVFVEWEESL
ncbi:MAG: winged helix-turn-helix transcriptional regulator [Anaerolineaceae bacterium]|nr:winged helix-turn-helix transcriptional regulator [Anaerolineaceae bacterium]